MVNPMLRMWVASRECHGFTNPCGLVPRVPAGAGVGWEFVTLAQPVPVTWVWRVARDLPVSVIESHAVVFNTNAMAHHNMQARQVEWEQHGARGGRKHNERAGIQGAPPNFSFCILTIWNQQNHDTRKGGYAPPRHLPWHYLPHRPRPIDATLYRCRVDQPTTSTWPTPPMPNPPGRHTSIECHQIHRFHVPPPARHVRYNHHVTTHTSEDPPNDDTGGKAGACPALCFNFGTAGRSMPPRRVVPILMQRGG